MLSIAVVGLTLLIASSVYAQFDIPEPEVVFYEPRGFRVSIPADPDIKLFAFHGRKNEQLQGTDAGTWNVDVTRATDGKLVFEDSTTKFTRGDYLSYWIHVVLHSGQGYNRLDLREEAKDFVPRTQNSFQSPSPIGYEVPTPEVKVFSRGFEVSIPEEEGITLFAFHGQLNQPFTGLQAGQWATDITRPTEGRFRFTERSTRLKPGDILYFWVHVIYNGLGYNLEGQEYRVDDTGSGAPPTPSTQPRPTPRPTPGPTQPTATPVSASTCERSPTVLKDGSHPCAGELIFEDDFQGRRLGHQWEIEKRFGSVDPDNEFVIYLNRSENLQVSGGHLKFKPTFTDRVFSNRFSLDIEDCTGETDSPACSRSREKFPDILPPVISARINTKSHFHFLYGKIEIRAKLPTGDWIFPELFLESAKNTYSGENLQSGQMRVAFVAGGPCNTQDLYQGVLLDSREPFRTRNLCVKRHTSGGKWAKDFHTYTLIWTPEKISTFVDGTFNCEVLPIDGFWTHSIDNGQKYPGANKWQQLGTSKMAPFDQEFFLTLGLGVGGHNDFQDTKFCRLPWSNTSPRAMNQFWQKRDDWITSWESNDPELRIDYVRVYAI
ncbi:beta-1,3-glucan-binding protein 1 [Lutzomyia longipalpis]|uniref:beta-1,3-glucan-binding protein 1 n=1 Tax=Lutzomyia longipalpis TaxID=7200 RepID=UPI00248413AD|nr:beta-1,3-glucan-binding protein 1 [Lutzomyia longipalpis]